MTARTLEEIEALDAQANASGETTRMRVMEFPRLLAIAQEQRAREALIVEAAVAEIRQQRRFALEESECGGPEINDSLDMVEWRFRDAIALIGTKR